MKIIGCSTYLLTSNEIQPSNVVSKKISIEKENIYNLVVKEILNLIKYEKDTLNISKNKTKIIYGTFDQNDSKIKISSKKVNSLKFKKILFKQKFKKLNQKRL